MKISVIIPSYLGDYPNCATNRESKFIRMLESVWNQDCPSFEIIIVADGCYKTVELVDEFMKENSGTNTNDIDRALTVIPITKQSLFSGFVRNAGIKETNGYAVCYLDTDDIMRPGHLKALFNFFNNHSQDWVYFDDHVATSNPAQAEIKRNSELKFGHIGCSNIAHKRSMNVQWSDGYGHDWKFIQDLQSKSSDYQKTLTPPGILVCHIPGGIDI